MIKLNLKNMLLPKLQNGINSDELNVFMPKMREVKENFKAQKKDFGFTRLPYAYNNLKRELTKAGELAKNMDTIVVIGIGGSDLGTRAIFKALKSQYYNEVVKDGRKLYFTGDTVDPETLNDLIEALNLSKTLFLVVSKSGNTVEQASVFVFLRDLVLKQLGQGKDTEHFVFLTDPNSGTLRKLANEQGYKTIDIPSDVGGRFSVLSSVGMVPAHLIGINIEEVLKGASDIENEINNNEEFNKDFSNFVALQYLYYKSGKIISVLMPYQYSLFEFARWFRQLWAESLGKKLDINGNEVFEGITPVAALGPTDQHSQLQLYNEGPNDKVFTFISAENSRSNLKLPEDYSEVKDFEFLKDRNFQEILNYAQQTTAFALTKNNRPNALITLPKVDEYHIGQLFYFFELALVHLGLLLNVNSFDQPGVELSKNAMYGILGKEGYDKEKKEFEEYLQD